MSDEGLETTLVLIICGFDLKIVIVVSRLCDLGLTF